MLSGYMTVSVDLTGGCVAKITVCSE